VLPSLSDLRDRNPLPSTAAAAPNIDGPVAQSQPPRAVTSPPAATHQRGSAPAAANELFGPSRTRVNALEGPSRTRVNALEGPSRTRVNALEGPSRTRVNALEGKPLRYLIGAQGPGPGRDDEVTVVSYDTTQPAKRGISIAYCNLFDELDTGRYGPYLHTSDTAAEYNEGQIDPRGPGWEKNLREQFERRSRQDFEYVELDNPDAYAIQDVIGAIELAASYGLKVIAKNPGLMRGGSTSYVAHPNVHGIIVERGAGSAGDMDELRRKAGKPTLPVWFVAFGSGRAWAGSVASAAKQYRNMGVTYSSAGEYGNAVDILSPA
jgi:hypothetical protein